jgi:hypothetical protein
MLARKGLFIVFLISLIAAYFYLRPYFYGREPEPNIVDRIPVGDFLGKIKLLDVAREANSFLYYNKLPFRDFLTAEFILAQGKNYGLDIQKPAYVFANADGEWGAIIAVTDSSKILQGVSRLSKNIDIKDTLVGGQRVSMIPDQKIYMTYGERWLFVYKGNQLPKRMYHVIYSKKDDIHPRWKDFLGKKQFTNESVSVYSTWKKFKKNGVKTAMFSYDCDSMQFRIKTYLKSVEPLNIALKDTGLAIHPNINMDKYLSLHFNVAKLRNNPSDPLVKWLYQMTKRISFPLNDFLKAWEGDLTFQEGGQHTIKESYIETEFDDEFNATEVRKQKDVLVSGYTLLLSMNSFQKEFISRLFAKGIMRKEENRFYILTSPPLKINQKPKYLILHSGNHAPKIVNETKNGGYWQTDKMKLTFNLDSLNNREVFFSVNFLGMSFLRKNRVAF